MEESVASHWQEKKKGDFYVQTNLSFRKFNIMFPISKYFPLYFNSIKQTVLLPKIILEVADDTVWK